MHNNCVCIVSAWIISDIIQVVCIVPIFLWAVFSTKQSASPLHSSEPLIQLSIIFQSIIRFNADFQDTTCRQPFFVWYKCGVRASVTSNRQVVKPLCHILYKWLDMCLVGYRKALDAACSPNQVIGGRWYSAFHPSSSWNPAWTTSAFKMMTWIHKKRQLIYHRSSCRRRGSRVQEWIPWQRGRSHGILLWQWQSRCRGAQQDMMISLWKACNKIQWQFCLNRLSLYNWNWWIENHTIYCS